MKERPILFNADMVRAILDGRKTRGKASWENRRRAEAQLAIARRSK